MKESVHSVLPITLIIIAICFTIVPVSTDAMLSFLIGALMLIAGMGLFTLGAENAMIPLGNATGTWMTKTRRLWIIFPLSFILGAAVTIAEPDLQVLASNVPHIDRSLLIVTVAAGVGFFLLVAMLRIFFGLKLKLLLTVLYSAVFILAFMSNRDFLSIAFDSGGVTTGPMTVPFIMALGVGVAMLRSDKNAAADSFGLIALCSVGPILTVLILGFIFNGNGAASQNIIKSYADTLAISSSYIAEIPEYLIEVAKALSPIFLFFLIFQAAVLKLKRNYFLRMLAGIVYTYVGLVLFLTGVNVGFSPLGTLLGGELSRGNLRFLLIPVAMLMGWYTISAEPAVQVLNRQVEEITNGAISAKAMGLSLSIGVSCAMGLSMLRILTRASILWFLVPGYAASLLLMPFVSDIFTSIAFDSGGVASGPMTAAFMLPFAIGASAASGGNIMTDAFGLVAMVAMMPLITIQIMGVIYRIKLKKAQREAVVYGDSGIEVIDLWEGKAWN
jgi:hypothetical protein